MRKHKPKPHDFGYTSEVMRLLVALYAPEGVARIIGGNFEENRAAGRRWNQAWYIYFRHMVGYEEA